MKILSATQIRKLDAYTIEHEPISSIELIERASLIFVSWFAANFDAEDRPIYIFCGPGNNGADGLAVTRLLFHSLYTVHVFQCKIGDSTSIDFQENLNRLPDNYRIPFEEIYEKNIFPSIPTNAIVIDAIFGSGLNRPIDNYWEDLIQHINQHPKEIISIDIPSGLFPDQATDSISIHATHSLSFEFPKLAFFFPENAQRVGKWQYKSIGLLLDFIANIDVSHFYIKKEFVKPLLKKREKFNHKGNFGHALLLVGSHGKVGAACLAAKACMRAGVGLLTIHTPICAYPILQSSIPEAMVSSDSHDAYITTMPATESYQAIGMGCGIGLQKETGAALKKMLRESNVSMVLDADALNIISQEKGLLQKMSPDTILTPHPKEFERLFGESKNDFERNELQIAKAKEHQIIIVLKGAHTCIALPDGTAYFNSTGNPGMATAGSGDVLTGILTSLLAQGYTPKDAAILGVYLHGLAGDLAAQKLGQEALMAGDLISNLGNAFLDLQA